MHKEVEMDVRMMMGACVLLAMFVIVGEACTRPQRQVVRTVLDLADAVCGDNDTPEECLTKCQTELARQEKRP